MQLLVVIDDKSLQKQRWPWSREYYAEMFDSNDIASKGFDHHKYKTLSTLIRKVRKPSKKMKEVFPSILAKDELFNKVCEIRDTRMREYLQNNRECIRQEAEKYLAQAQKLYNPKNKQAYSDKLALVKNLFDADTVENIIARKQLYQNNLNFQKENLQRQACDTISRNFAREVQSAPELEALLNPYSPDFSREIFNLVESNLHTFGKIDIPSTMKAIDKIKEMGIRQYIAKRELEKATANANVQSGGSINTSRLTSMPTADELKANPNLYEKACKKFGMDKIDAVIMKG